MAMQDTLLEYANWLDAQGDGASDKPHEQLVREFIEEHPEPENDTPWIDVAREAVSAFVETDLRPNTIMTAAVLMYEVSKMSDDGEDVEYLVSYSSLTDSSMATCVGVGVLGLAALRSAMDGDDDDE